MFVFFIPDINIDEYIDVICKERKEKLNKKQKCKVVCNSKPYGTF